MSGKQSIMTRMPVCRAMAEDLETPMFWPSRWFEMDDQFEFFILQDP